MYPSQHVYPSSQHVYPSQYVPYSTFTLSATWILVNMNPSQRVMIIITNHTPLQTFTSVYTAFRPCENIRYPSTTMTEVPGQLLSLGTHIY